MNKIKKRLEAALAQMQLAKNEADRLCIMKKPVELDDESLKLLLAIGDAAADLGTKPASINP